MQASRANTLDGILDELPDLSDGYFSYEVDQLFPQYVDMLNTKGIEDTPMDRAPNGAGNFAFLDMDQLGDSNLSSGSPVLGIENRIGQAPMDYNLLPGTSKFIPQEPQSSDLIPQFPEGVMEMPEIAALSQPGNEPLYSEGSGSGHGSGRRTSGRAMRGKNSSDFHGDSDAMDSDDAAPQRKGGRAPGKPKRNAKQQAQNKQAQQRYRERRKQRFNDMEHTIDDLTARLQQMQAVKSQNALLVAKSHELEAILAAKDQELDQLKHRVDTPSITIADRGESFEQQRQAEEALIHDLQGQAAVNVGRMKQIIQQHGLRNVDPSGQGVDPHVLRELETMIGQCGSTSTSLRPDGVQVLRMMSADASLLSRIRCMRKNEGVQRGLQEIRLTPQQKSQVLMLRAKHIKDIRDVYEKRQQLNIKATTFMVPSDNVEARTKLERMGKTSYRRIALQTVEFDKVLSDIKDNLRLEQKWVMELSFCTLHRILTPLQAALYITEISPMSFDALELANTLAMEVEEAQLGGTAAPAVLADEHSSCGNSGNGVVPHSSGTEVGG